MQGKVWAVVIVACKLGITPACAGKSEKENIMLKKYKDHPCVCREKLTVLYEHSVIPGSPLRVQGKELHNTDIFSQVRITPACAGKSTGEVLFEYD